MWDLEVREQYCAYSVKNSLIVVNDYRKDLRVRDLEYDHETQKFLKR